MAYHLDIVSGPSKMELMLALFDSSNQRERPVEFTTQDRGGESYAYDVRITQVGKEDGSGESWLFEGYTQSGRPVGGYFSTTRRRGHMHIFETLEDRLRFTGCIGYADAPARS